ncbi:hypothetical protein [Agaribacterium sp. ZY112]|uniref:hypothetical protein n=1 Tax=Agaribacterium sp. ZY112 TaxID=3233574 RepID=UPI0035259B61
MFSVQKLKFLLISIVCFGASASIVQADMIKANEAIADGDFKDAKEYLLDSAVLGSAEAQFKLGLLFAQGQSGVVDMTQAASWLALAAEQNYSGASALVQEILAGSSHEESVAILNSFTELESKYSAKALTQSLYPEKSSSGSVIGQNAKRLSDGNLSYDAIGHNINRSMGIEQANRRTGGLFSENARAAAINTQEAPSGKVIVVYDITENGFTSDPDIVFSYPGTTFDRAVLDSAVLSKYLPAQDIEGKPIRQNGFTRSIIFGLQYSMQLDKQYPQTYDKFRLVRLRAKKGDPANEYAYSAMLRAYGNILAPKDEDDFMPYLQSAAKAGVYNAQYDLAMYELYIERNVQEGLKWLKLAASSGLTKAEYRMGKLLLNPPNGVLETSTDKAKFWFERAAKKHHVAAVEKYASLVIDSEDKKKLKDLRSMFKEIKGEESRSAESYYLNAQVEQKVGSKRKAKSLLKKAISEAEKSGRSVKQWDDQLATL